MGNLLRVGFGNEGALNIAKRWTLKVHPYRISLGLNACGKSMNAIIVSVQIKDFYLVNSEIKEESIVFMNRVAKVVHDCAVTWDGNCKSSLYSTSPLYPTPCRRLASAHPAPCTHRHEQPRRLVRAHVEACEQ